MNAATDDRSVTCERCERDIACCRVCNDERCESSTCYRCLIFDVHQSIDQPHDHGG